MSGIQQFWTDSLFLIPNWKWIAIVTTITIGVFLKRFLQSFFRKAKASPKFDHLHPYIKDFLKMPIESALAWIAITMCWYFSLNAIQVSGNFEKYLRLMNQLIQSFALIRLAYLSVEALGHWMSPSFIKAQGYNQGTQLAEIATKTLKGFVIVLGSLIVLQSLQVNVLSLLAGLGLGGLALALAAQDTAANFFGSVNIILDKPFKVGDFIIVAGVEGKVEQVGFRSTRLRTAAKSLVCIPNSMMSKEKIENLSLRTSRRVRHLLNFDRNSGMEKVQQFIEQTSFLISNHPLIDKNLIIVTMQKITDWGPQILMQYFINTEDLNVEISTQQEILIDVNDIASNLNLNFARIDRSVLADL